MVSLSTLEATCLVLSLGDPLDQMWCLVSVLWQFREEESVLAHGLRREAHTACEAADHIDFTVQEQRGVNADVHSSFFPFVHSGPQMHSVCCFPYSGWVFPQVKFFWKYTVFPWYSKCSHDNNEN